jgi:branched-chain amino acid transport system ATP-binding protein
VNDILEIQNLSKSFGHLLAVRSVSLSIAANEIRAIIGPNGAGKTTLFNLISGAIRADTGSVVFQGRDISHLSAHKRVRRGLSRTFQVPNVFPELSVRENFRLGVEASYRMNALPFVSRARHAQVGHRTEELLTRLGLDGKAERLVGELAHGDQRIVEIGLALSLGARLLMLDEPTAGMGDEETEATVQLIRDLWEKEGVTILFIEHDMQVVFGVAHRITVLNFGSVLTEGTPDEIANNEKVQTAYLGAADAEAHS